MMDSGRIVCDRFECFSIYSTFSFVFSFLENKKKWNDGSVRLCANIFYELNGCNWMFL